MEPTRDQLQAEILEILYNKSLQKPIWVSSSEVYWNITNLKVSERSVKEVLDWLVKNDLVLHQADKYQIDKREFLDMTKRKKVEEDMISEMPTPTAEAITNPHIRSSADTSIIGVHERATAQASQSSYSLSFIVILLSFVLSGIVLGLLVFNSFSESQDKVLDDGADSFAVMVDSVDVHPLSVPSVSYIRDSYALNKNFKNINGSFVEQQKINGTLSEAIKNDRRSMDAIRNVIISQHNEILKLRRDRNIFLWILGISLFLLTGTLIFRYRKKD